MTPLEAVQNREECGYGHRQHDKEPADVDAPERQLQLEAVPLLARRRRLVGRFTSRQRLAEADDDD